MRCVQQSALAEMGTDDLQTNRQFANEAARNGDSRQTCEIGADRVDVIEIHGDRIRGLGTYGECRRRRRRTHQYIHLAEGTTEVRSDELPDLLRLEVVSIVVTRGQHVGACHDTTLHLGPESFTARAFVQIHQIARLLATMTESDTIDRKSV